MLSMHPLKIMQKNISRYRKNSHDTILWRKQVHAIMYDPFLRGKIFISAETRLTLTFLRPNAKIIRNSYVSSFCLYLVAKFSKRNIFHLCKQRKIYQNYK